jgi:hypothetical protein
MLKAISLITVHHYTAGMAIAASGSADQTEPDRARRIKAGSNPAVVPPVTRAPPVPGHEDHFVADASS